MVIYSIQITYCKTNKLKKTKNKMAQYVKQFNCPRKGQL